MEKKTISYGTASSKELEPLESLLKRTNAARPHHHSLLGIIFILLGSFSFSVMFLLVKWFPDANTFTLVLYRSIVQIAISFAMLLYNGDNPLGMPGTRFWICIRGFFGCLAVAAWFFGLQILSLPDAVTLQFTTPPIAAVFAVCLLGEKWSPLDKVGAVVCLTGVALIAHPTWIFGPGASSEVPEQDDGDNRIFMKALAVLITEAGTACAGIAYVAVRKVEDPSAAAAMVMVLYYGVISIPVCILGFVLIEGDWNILALPDATVKEYFLLLLMGFGGFGGQWFTNLGLQRETAATATLGMTTQIVWTYIFELTILHEGINGWSIAGTGCIVGYMLIVALVKILPGGDEGESEPLLSEVHVAEEITGSFRDIS